VVISNDQVRYMQLFRSLMGVTVLDVVSDEEENRLIFVVGEGELGRAVGRGGRKLRAMKNLLWRDLRKDIEVVEYSSDPVRFICNLLSPARVVSVRISDGREGRVALVKVLEEDVSVAIGRNGRRIKRARLLAKRWFDIDNVKISTT